MSVPSCADGDGVHDRQAQAHAGLVAVHAFGAARKGSMSVETNCGVIFTPVFSTVRIAVAGTNGGPTHTEPFPGRLWTIALCTRFWVN